MLVGAGLGLVGGVLLYFVALGPAALLFWLSGRLQRRRSLLGPLVGWAFVLVFLLEPFLALWLMREAVHRL